MILTEAFDGCDACGSGGSIGVNLPDTAMITIADNDEWELAAAAGVDDEAIERDSTDTASFTISRQGVSGGVASDSRYPMVVDFVMGGAAAETNPEKGEKSDSFQDIFHS